MVSGNGNERLIVKALIEAKKEFGKFIKNKVNPHYKSKYADMSAVAEAVDEALAKNGLTYVQPFEYKDGVLLIQTRLLHTSGEELSSTYPIIVTGHKPQEVGGSITYGRRYALTSLLGLAADDDDDGNDAPEDTVPRKPASFTTDPRQAAKDAKKAEEKKAPTQLPADPAAGLANVTVQSLQPGKINGIDCTVLKTSGGDFIVDVRKVTAKDILKLAQSAVDSKNQVVIDFTTTASGNNVVKTVRMEG